MNIFDLYANPDHHDDLTALFVQADQLHDELPAHFLEKDIWVTEILRLLYEEDLLDGHAVAFKGGTALSKCWQAIERFSEDIDLSIHWSDLASEEDEEGAWQRTTSNPSQRKKFRRRQRKKLTEWSTNLTETLNNRLSDYGIDGLIAELDTESNGEKINIHYPKFTTSTNKNHLDYVLLEFGGRNRGRPTVSHDISSYMGDIEELSEISFPKTTVQAYDPNYILWEKLTALHSFCTQSKELNTKRLSRHWYDVDCLLQNDFADPITSKKAMNDVISMKSQRWPVDGVVFESIQTGNLQLIPDRVRSAGVSKDHADTISANMFFNTPDSFDTIIKRIRLAQDKINKTNKPATKTPTKPNQTTIRFAYSGAYVQAIATHKGKDIYSRLYLIKDEDKAISNVRQKIK